MEKERIKEILLDNILIHCEVEYDEAEKFYSFNKKQLNNMIDTLYDSIKSMNQESKLLQNDVIDLIRNSCSNASARRIIKQHL